MKITAENFIEVFSLDYAAVLAFGLDAIDDDSPVVSCLVEWCSERGYDVSREVCAEVIRHEIDGRKELA